MPKLQTSRIVGPINTEEEEEDGGQALHFKDSPIEPQDDEEEVIENEQLQEGVKMIKIKDGSTKMVFNRNPKDIVEKMRKNI